MSIALVIFTTEEETILKDKVSILSSPVTTYNADSFTEDMARKHTHVICAAHPESRQFLIDLGIALNVQPLTDCEEIIDTNNFKRPAHAGNAVLTINDKQPIKLISLNIGRSHNDKKDLRHARVVIGGGRPFGSKENFKMAYDLADTLDGVVGATRAAVDAGYIGNEWQIGQTGQPITADLYIACAIAGAVQHISGIRGARTVIAINKDPNAPIFKHATYGLAADIFDVLPELTKRLSS